MGKNGQGETALGEYMVKSHSLVDVIDAILAAMRMWDVASRMMWR